MSPRPLLALALATLAACGDSKTKPNDNLPPEAAIAGGDRDGVVGVPISFDGSGSKDPDGALASRVWDFGDLGSSTEAVASHTYQTAGDFTVTLTVTDDRDATDTASVVVHVAAKVTNKAPLPVIKGPTTLEVGQAGDFDASGSTDPDGTIAGYDWGFGDGATAKGEKVQHAWATPGSYDVTLLATDDKGATATAKLTVNVVARSNQPPRADAGAAKTGNPGVALDFDGSASFDPDGTIAAYEWDFGDSTAKATTAKAAHAYAAVGVYTARLTVTDDKGATGTATATVDIQAVDYSGTYSVNANPQTLKCSIQDATWVPTQLVLTISGATASADEFIPPDTKVLVHYSGTWNEATKSFHMTGTYSESLAVHNYTYDGTFSDPKTFTGKDVEVIKDALFGSTTCTLNWNVTGTR